MAARKSTPRKAARGRRAAARKTPKPARKRVSKRRAASPPRRTAARKPTPRRTRVKAASARRVPTRKAAKTATKAKAVRAKASAPKPKPKPSSALSKPASRPAPVPGPPSTLGRKRSTPPLARGLHPKLERDRRVLPDEDRLDLSNAPDDRLMASARSGHDDLKSQLQRHHESGPELTAGDVDASWADAYALGDEAPGGDNPTPDQDRVDDIGRALGIQYADGEELKGSDKIAERDRHRWELDPASSEDWPHKPEESD